MTKLFDQKQKNNWFYQKGDENDVTISSRVRYARNIAGVIFPGNMTVEDEKKSKELIIKAFKQIKSGYEIIKFSDLSPIQRRLLMEQNLISQNYSLNSENILIVNNEHNIFGVVNEIDHLRLSCFSSGFSLKQSFTYLDEIDTRVEDEINYAASIDFGYLNSEITNIGTGMKASVMLHLPCLIETGIIDKALKAVVQVGLSVKGFFSDDKNSLGDMYQISNQITFGISEKEIIEKLEGVVKQLVEYERKAREEVLKNKKIFIEDKVLRALGTLRYCKSISSKEAINLLSIVRLGISLGVIKDISLETITSLFFLIQNSHMYFFNTDIDEETDEEYLDYKRAKYIKSRLGCTENTGGC